MENRCGFGSLSANDIPVEMAKRLKYALIRCFCLLGAALVFCACAKEKKSPLTFKLVDGNTQTCAVVDCDSTYGQTVEIPSEIKLYGDVRKVVKIEKRAFASSDVKNVIIPNTVKEIGKEAFCGCLDLERITLPAELECIEEGTFRECANLKKVVFPSHLRSIGERVFGGCAQLKSVDLPNTITQIGAGAFAFTGLEKVELPPVSKINAITFLGCPLESVSIPETVERIGAGAFQLCTKLTVVNMTNSVKCIEKEAFFGCKALTTINIPDSIADIDETAFVGCGR